MGNLKPALWLFGSLLFLPMFPPSLSSVPGLDRLNLLKSAFHGLIEGYERRFSLTFLFQKRPLDVSGKRRQFYQKTLLPAKIPLLPPTLLREKGALSGRGNGTKIPLPDPVPSSIPKEVFPRCLVPEGHTIF